MRRKRKTPGNGRVYLVVATATHEDTSSRRCATVVVPHDRSRWARWSVHLQAKKARVLCELGHIPGWHHLLLEGSLTESNEAPRVDAGPDQGIDLGAPAWLDGTVEDDGLPSGRLDTTWRKVEGPGDVWFSAPSSPDTEATFGAAGTDVLELSATVGVQWES